MGSNTPSVQPRNLSRDTQAVLVVVVLCLLAFGLWSYRLESMSIGYEESLSLYQARLGVPGFLSGAGSGPAIAAPDRHPPLYFLLLGAFIRLAGESDLALRFLSVAWAILLVAMLYAAGERLWGRRVGVCAALLGALSPLYFWYAREAGLYTMVAALGLFAVYALDRALERGCAGWLVAAALGAVAASYTDHLALLLWPALALQALLLPAVHPRRRLAALAAVAGGLVASLPEASYTLWQWSLDPKGHLSLLAAARDVLPAWRAGPALALPALWPIDLAGLLLFLLGALWRAPHRRWAVICSYGLIPLLPLVVTWPSGPTGAASRLLLLASPALYLGIGRGLASIGRRFWPLALALALSVLGGMGFASGAYLRAAQAVAGPPFQAAARFVEQGERAGDLILVAAPDGATAFVHYYQGQLPTIALPSGQMAGQQPSTSAQDAAARHDRIWLVTCGATAPEAPQPAVAWLHEKAFLANAVTYAGSDWPAAGPAFSCDVGVQLYLKRTPLLQDLPAMQHSLQVDLGKLRLEGYDLPLRPPAGGERAWVTLYWRALQPGARASVSLRLLDAQGRQWGESTEEPYPAFPSARWPVGQIVRVESSLEVPPGVPPGWYRLVLRLRDPDTGRPIEPLQGAGPGPLALGPIRVETTWAQQVNISRLLGGAQILQGGMRFGDVLALRAYSLGQQRVLPGTWQQVNLYWQIDHPWERSLSMTLELIDGRGETAGLYRVSPFLDEYPLYPWQGGELLWTQHDILIPASAGPGPYRLRLSLRDEGGRQLPIRDRWLFWTWGQGDAWLARMQVLDVPRQFDRPPLEHTREVQSTAGFGLLGYSGVPAQAGDGKSLSITLYWRALAVPARSYKVSLQLLGADQRTILVQEDSVPVNWTRPTTGWGQGEIIADTHQLTIPTGAARQEAGLIVAVYDEDTGRRVQWLEADGIQERVGLCQVEIVD